ncbi:MAG: porin [Pseudoflavonifractor sp.]|nr:porin [Pseudoflavonifractor sp.]
MLALSLPMPTRAEKSEYIPEVHGTLRTRAEWATETGEYRFQVRNARVSIGGNVGPSVSYYVNTDFCDQGKIKILDVWARLSVTRGLYIQAGQFRMPFGVDPFRAPHTYYFANRSFIGKQICNFRAVGAKASYTMPSRPLTIEAGLFSPATIGDHTGWEKKLTYSCKASYRIDNVTLTTGFQSVIPGGVRANLVDGCVSWGAGRWIVEGEYMHEQYTASNYDGCHAYNLFADYHMPIKAGIFNRLSFQGRFDGMTDHGRHRDDNGMTVTDNPGCNRVTVGTTISYLRSKSMYVDLRLDYEKYFYKSNTAHTPDAGDKAVLELVLRF